MKPTGVNVVVSLNDAGLCVESVTIASFVLARFERVRDTLPALDRGERVRLVTDWDGLERAQRIGAEVAGV